MKKLIYLLLFLCFACTGQTGKVIRVIDGDTFIFQTATQTLRVRMYGIDAPELTQDYGQQAKKFMAMYTGFSGELQTFGKDKYGRTIGKLIINGQDINLKMVTYGQAWCYEYYCHDSSYINAQQSAKYNRLGLWANKSIPPWVFRKQHVKEHSQMYK